jgi:hypothetical protein
VNQALSLLVVAVLAGGVIALAFDSVRRRERAWERRERAWETERQDLLNRIMFLTDKTWTIPPAELTLSTTAPYEEVADEDQVSYDPMYVMPHETV